MARSETSALSDDHLSLGGGEESGGTHALLQAALRRWQRATGPYWLYVCAAPFLQAIDLPQRSAARPALGVLDPILSTPADECAALFLDLPPTATLPLTGELNRQGYTVVPIIQRWVAAPAVLPCGQLARQLIEHSPAAPVAHPRSVVFLLDGERAGSSPRAPTGGEGRGERAISRSHQGAARSRSTFDNRYHYPLCRFPPPALLHDQGITAVRWIARDGIAPDLDPYARRLAESGLAPGVIAVDQG